ncbi:MAG: Leucyl aminopeptidase (aminopeptidase T)-like protein [Alphaproteobacteria bacterium]|nr:Leucyl aminopeptidase (aminopeptidase T)-like protein [Alphaproteobacteria bacterium]
MISPITLGPAIKERADFLAYAPPSMLSEMVTQVLRDMALPQSIAQAITTLHELQRLYLVHVLELMDHPQIIAALDNAAHFPLWQDFAALEASETQKDRLAHLMYSGDPFRRASIFLNISDYAKEIAERIVQKIIDHHEGADIWISDPWFHRRLLHVCDKEKAETYGDLMAQRMENSQRMIAFAGNHQSIPVTDPVPPVEMSVLYTDQYNRRHRENSPNLFYTSTRLPTPQSAKADNIPYAEYVDLFFRMCDVDYTQIDAAHRVLIAKLDNGKILRITNEDGTNITMDVSGFTFANSLVAKNVPGSEVFSAPHRNSVNGKIVAKGFFTPKDGSEIIQDITLEFENGRIIRYDAASGFEHLQCAIETDEGSHYIGEIGIGTNPALQSHVTNSLMVEKIGGSFHVAVGRAYEYTDYLGTPVHLDNGNRSKIHWDITTMLVGKSGRMILDGETIMDNGKFTDPALSYLNGPKNIEA